MVTLRNVFFPERQTERETLLTMSMNELTNSTFEIVYRIYNDLIFFLKQRSYHTDTAFKGRYDIEMGI